MSIWQEKQIKMTFCLLAALNKNSLPKWKAISCGADDEARTRDLNLGKVALYQLSYICMYLPKRVQRCSSELSCASFWRRFFQKKSQYPKKSGLIDLFPG
jgi:hypothetical protein